MTLDANEVAPGLWQGGAPPLHTRLPFDVVVLVSSGFQPPRHAVGAPLVIRAPYDDGRLSTRESVLALRVAERVQKFIRRGKRVLVTCSAGWNRSGLINGLVLISMQRFGMYGDADAAIAAVRRARGEHALGNHSFQQFLRATAAMASAQTYRSAG